jgi:acyl-coenzyme A thioesterase PaaI-like protein
MREGDERARSDLARAGGAAAFTLVSEEEMLATSDFTLKLVAPAVGDRFIGRESVIARTGTTTISRADIFAVKDKAETMFLCDH